MAKINFSLSSAASISDKPADGVYPGFQSGNVVVFQAPLREAVVKQFEARMPNGYRGRNIPVKVTVSGDLIETTANLAEQEMKAIEIDLIGSMLCRLGSRKFGVNVEEVAVSPRNPTGGNCFDNAMAALDDLADSWYIVGYRVINSLPHEHAWIRKGTTSYDPTSLPLNASETPRYFSFAFTSQDYAKTLAQKLGYSPQLNDVLSAV